MLPQSSLIHIFSALDIYDVLTSSSLVCSSWAEAAAAWLPLTIQASAQRDLDFCSDSSSFELLLQKHGSHLTQLHVRTFVGCSPLSQLPCPKLQDLLLQDGFLQLGQGSSLSSDLSALTELTSLEIKRFAVISEQRNPLAALTAMQRLQHLSLHHIQQHPTAVPETLEGDHELSYYRGGFDSVDLPEDLLQHLPALLSLKLNVQGEWLQEGVLQHLGAVTQLQHLQLPSAWGVSLEVLGQLQQLTYLHMGEVLGHLTASTAPGFSTLTALQHLQLFWDWDCSPPDGSAHWTFAPRLLREMSKLRKLDLSNVAMRPLDVHAPSPQGEEELLATLQGMQQLTSLTLGDIHNLGAVPAIAYSALTASSKLRHLWLHHCACSNTPEVWRHVFLANRALRWLRSLTFTAHPSYVTADPVCRLDTAAIACVVAACPRLRSIDVTGTLEREAQLDQLAQLRYLTRLAVDGSTVTASAACQTHFWTQMTCLRVLKIEQQTIKQSDDQSQGSGQLMPTGLLQLSVLQGLTRLDVLGVDGCDGCYMVSAQVLMDSCCSFLYRVALHGTPAP